MLQSQYDDIKSTVKGHQSGASLPNMYMAFVDKYNNIVGNLNLAIV